MTYDYLKNWSAKNTITGEETNDWNTAVGWFHTGQKVMIFHNGEHFNTWEPKPTGYGGYTI